MSNIEISNYDLHKQLFEKVEPLSKDSFNSKLINIGEWFSKSPKCNYYVLMCRDIYYYTVFHFLNMNFSKGILELKETLEGLGQIIDINYIHGEDAYECWIKRENGDIQMFYLFPADWMVIEIE